MKQKFWTFLIVDTKSSNRTGSVRLHKSVLVCIAVLVVIAGIGFARLAYFGAAYASAKFGVYQEKIENRMLLNKLAFLHRFIEHEENAIAEMSSFEDAMRLQYGLNTVSSDVRKAGVGGRPTPEELVMETLDDPLIQKVDTIKRTVAALLRQIELQRATLQDMSVLVNRQHDLWAQRPSIWPARGSLTSTFGYRTDPVAGYMQFHEGLDIANTEWTPVVATADGMVRVAGTYMDYGNTVILEHPLSGYKTLYAHLVRCATIEGQFVRRGEVIGYMGTTGKSTGPHLHYGVYRLSALVNPLDYILPEDTVID
jgi:murein DD-endopeptidase MepM/ murein hydrolase activator NlpD